MSTSFRQVSAGSSRTASIAQQTDGTSFAAQARAQELASFRNNRDRYQVLQDPAVDPSNETFTGEMPQRRQRWQPVDLDSLPQPSPPAAPEDHLSITGNGNDQLSTGAQSTFSHPFRPRSRSQLKNLDVLVTATYRRQAKSRELSDSNASPTGSDMLRRPSPFPSDQSNKSLLSMHHEYAAHMQPPVVNLPAPHAKAKPPGHYPAVKGTSTDQIRQSQTAELRAGQSLIPFEPSMKAAGEPSSNGRPVWDAFLDRTNGHNHDASHQGHSSMKILRHSS